MVYIPVDRDKKASHNISILIKILEKRGGKPFKVRLDMDDLDGYVEPPRYIFIRNLRDIINYEGILGYADKISMSSKKNTELW